MESRSAEIMFLPLSGAQITSHSAYGGYRRVALNFRSRKAIYNSLFGLLFMIYVDKRTHNNTSNYIFLYYIFLPALTDRCDTLHIRWVGTLLDAEPY